jgi:hypothetical protein
MAKRFILGLLIAAALVGSTYAVDWKSYPDSVQPGNILINAGVGFGTPLSGTMAIPPLSVSADVAMPLGGLPFSVGGLFGFNTSTYYDWHYTGMVFAGRLGYHPDFGFKNLDTYANFSLGYYIFTADVSGATSYSTFYYGFNVGGRKFFTNNLGAFVELGYSALSFISAGVTLKL